MRSNTAGSGTFDRQDHALLLVANPHIHALLVGLCRVQAGPAGNGRGRGGQLRTTDGNMSKNLPEGVLGAHAIDRMQSAVQATANSRAASTVTDVAVIAEEGKVAGATTTTAAGASSSSTTAAHQLRRVYSTHKANIGIVLLLLIFTAITIAPVIDPSACPAGKKMAGVGEFTVLNSTSSAPGATKGTRISAPIYPTASNEIPEGGVSGRAIWAGDPCLASSEDKWQEKEPGIDDGGEAILNCDLCPVQLNPSFNTSILVGKVLMLNFGVDARVRKCGVNQLARALGGTGIVALAYASNYDTSRDLLPVLPGMMRKWYTASDTRGTAPQQGDVGIPMPFVDSSGGETVTMLAELLDGHVVHVELTPTQPNPWLSLYCGVWLPVRAVFACIHLMMSERAACELLAHVRIAGSIQMSSFAHMALLAESFANLAPVPNIIDP